MENKPLRWDTPLAEMPGIGPARQKALQKLGLTVLGDLLPYYPRRYEDRTQIYPIAQAPINVPCCIRAMVAQPPQTNHIRRGMDLLTTQAVDDAAAVRLVFFNQPYLKNVLRQGTSYTFYGKLDLQGGRRQMVNPTFEEEGKEKFTGRIFPRYALSGGLSNNNLVTLMAQALPVCLPRLTDILPVNIRQAYRLIDARTACAQIHFPVSWEALDAARRRLSFEELFFLTLGLQLLRTRRDDAQGTALPRGDVSDFSPLLPFPLTSAQGRVLAQCARDLAGSVPMNRLVQGDVGSGKTAIAAFALWRAARNGAQGAMMAPTDLLARQHFETLTKFLAPAGIQVALLTASLPAPEKKKVRQGLADGSISVVVGTHALLSQGVDFARLAVAVVDEQHRFGVEQRSLLASKGDHPHLLVLSATPIPRTLALILYGDLDVSLLDELPPGRQPVETYLVNDALKPRLFRFMEKHMAQGRQVYVVCPAVEDAETGGEDLKSVKRYTEYLQTVFPGRSIAFVHGQMKGKDKEAVMSAFAAGEINLLVSTTVIEVGVDVPNAVLMVVENADRFGLSQLHQLRGRVGRGKYQSYCVLISNSRDPDTLKRLKTLCATTDGFKIAEEDLKTRGPGDFFGQRQHGLPQLHMADLAADMALLTDAQKAAQDVLADDPALKKPQNQPLLAQVRKLFAENPDIFN